MFIFTLINSFLVAVSLFYTQIYLTCLPNIASNLSVDHSFVQLAFTGNIFCFGISQLFYGHLSDYYGRKTCLLIGLWFALIGNISCLFSINIMMFFVGQLIAGIGAGSCSIIPRAISKDILTDTHLLKAITFMSIASTVATGLAPILGSIFQQYLGWRSVFLFLVWLTIITLILAHFIIPETIKKNHNKPFKSKIATKYLMLFTNRYFLANALVNSYAYTTIIIYLMLAPFLFQITLSFSPSFNGFIYLICASSYLLGNLLIGQLIKKMDGKKIIWLGLTAITTGSAFSIVSIFFQGISAWGLIICGLLIHLGSGLITPITYKQILNISEFSAGILAGAINATRVLVAFMFSLVAATFPLQGIAGLVLSGLLSIACISIYCFLSRKTVVHIEEKLI